MAQNNKLEEEIESWKGFPWAMRKDDQELWYAMIKEVRDDLAVAVEQSGRPLTTDAFFMALLLAQQKIIRRLRAELKALGVQTPDSDTTTMTTLDLAVDSSPRTDQR